MAMGESANKIFPRSGVKIVGAEQKSTCEDIFAGGGEMGALMRKRNWSQTPLGTVSGWSQSLRTVLSILLTSRHPIFLWWGSELIQFYNDAYRPILGQTKHPKAMGQRGRECWTEVWHILEPMIEAVMQRGESTRIDDGLLLLDRNGYLEECYFSYAYSPIRDETTGINGIFCACSETTGRVVGERRLRTLREIATNTAVANTIVEACQIATGTISNNPADIPFALLYLLDADKTHARLAGTAGIEQRTPASPTQIDLCVTPNLWQLGLVRQTGQAEMLSNLTAQFGTLPGGVWDASPESAFVVPILQSGQKQQVVGMLVLGISPRRAFDEEYRGFFELVAGNVTTAIANANALEAERKRAEALAELDRAKTVFFSNVSHEFRTPLTLMLSPTEDALSDTEAPLTGMQRERIELVQRNGVRLLKLVNTLLDFSRIEAGRVEAVYEPTDLAAFTAELASVFRSTIEQQRMQLIVNCPPLPEAIYVDRELWEKIVFNLLSNAFKFTFAGSITVQLQSLRTHVELTVADTGIGIPAEEIPHLFERFHRVKAAQGRSFEGSGIGLSLVAELVKLHSGTVNVTSAIGLGSCFAVSIPTGKAHLPSERIGVSRTITSTRLGAIPYLEEARRWEVETEQTKIPSEYPNVASQSLIVESCTADTCQTAKILLADDNADMRDYVKRLLSRRYIVETVADGKAALAAVRENPPNLVLTDVMMPGIDGFEVLRKLRADPQTQDIPIILLSARAGEESRIEGLEAGADDYLIKPFSARELLARVEACLKLAQLRETARVREQALRIEAQTAQANLQNILSSIRDGFLVLDQDWCYTYINDRQLEIIGMRREDVLGKNVWELFPDLVGSELDERFREAMLEQKPIQFEYYYESWNRWFENRIYPAPNGIAIICAEITDRKRAAVALQQSELNFRTLADTMPQIFWTARPDGWLDYYNQRWFDYTGMTYEQTQGWGWQPVLHPDDVQLCIDVWSESVRTGKDYTIEYRFRRASDGQYRWFLGRAFPLRNQHGKIIRWFGSGTDIHDQKSALSERDRALAQEQSAREEAERANRIKDEFLAVLSHELRSPLNPILGWSRLLQNGKLNPTKTAEALATIERNAKLQVQLIDDLLDVSRILRGKLVLNAMPLDFGSVIFQALDTVRLAADAKSLKIQKSITPMVSVIGDATRLQQVVWNLLSNAVKFTPPGGQIEVHLTSAGTDAQIQVKDTGKGIRADFLPYVFDHFQQEDGSTTRKFGGLGLGLAIVRQLVELHGGTVAVESPGEGQGATFTVKIPLCSNVVQTPILPQSTNQSLNLSGIHILVVDDEKDSREFITFVLTQEHATVTAVASGLSALKACAQAVPDLLISDIGMPEMDGYMLIRAIRALEQGKFIPAIALTAYAGEINQQQAIAAGFQRHITKPIDPNAVVEIAVELVQRRK